MTQHEKVLEQKISDLEAFLNTAEKYARTGSLGKTLGHPKVGIVLEKLSGNVGLFAGTAAAATTLFSVFHFAPGLAQNLTSAIIVGSMFMGPVTPVAAAIASRALNRYSSTNEMNGMEHHKVQKALQLLRDQNHPTLTAFADQATQLFKEDKTILAFWERFAYKTNALVKQIGVVKQEARASGASTPVFLTQQTVLRARAAATGVDPNEPFRLPHEKRKHQEQMQRLNEETVEILKKQSAAKL